MSHTLRSGRGFHSISAHRARPAGGGAHARRKLSFERLEPKQMLAVSPATDVFAAYGGIEAFENLVNTGGRAVIEEFYARPEVRAAIEAAYLADADAPTAIPLVGEQVEQAQIVAQLSAAGVVAEPTYTFTAVAKAAPDEWYTGIGQPHIPITSPKPSDTAKAKVNQDYVWGMTRSGSTLWFASGGNVLLQAASVIGAAGSQGRENKISVVEGAQSQNPNIPEELKPFIGDWRAPRMHRYDIATGKYLDVTPNDSRLQSTLGLRSAGANDDIVLFAGPDLTYLGMNVFAYNAKTGAYLGSRTFLNFSDIRRWENVNGTLYTSALRTFARTGQGLVLKWTGTVAAPFSYQIVGALDAEGAYIVQHKDRLYVSTWPLGYGSLMGILGYRSDAKAGIWMSPSLGTTGLTSNSLFGWRRVWGIEEYEPDPVTVKAYGGGAMESFDGYLYWGTMQVPGTGAVTFQEAYPDVTVNATQLGNYTYRAITIFRGKDFENTATKKVDLLYGDAAVMKFTPTSSTAGTWAPAPTLAGPAKYGKAGMGNVLNAYTWSMAVQDNKLYVGTFDLGTLVPGDLYVNLQGDVNVIESTLRTQYNSPGIWMGADLYVFEPGDTPATLVSNIGVGNPLNHGIRNMEATPWGLFLGSANCSNLLTAPYAPPGQPLKAGGWELIKVTTGLETPEPFFQRHYDFGTSSSAVATGYTRVSNSTRHSATTGYGWYSGTISGADRATGTALTRDINYTTDGTFVVTAPAGVYTVTLTLGDLKGARDLVSVYLEGNLVETVSTASGALAVKTYQVPVADGYLSIRLKDGGGVNAYAAIMALDVLSVDTLPPPPVERHYDFGTSTSPAATGYVPVNNGTKYSAAAGYGWYSGTIYSSDRATGTALTRDFNYTKDGTFVVALPAGTYTVGLTLGDLKAVRDQVNVYLENTLVETVATASGQYVLKQYQVAVTDGNLSVRLQDLGGANAYAAIMGLDIVQVVAGASVAPVNLTAAPAEWSAKYDFGTATSIVAAGYTQVAHSTLYSAAQGFGWQSGTIGSADRGTADALARDVNYTQLGIFGVDLLDGLYTVTLDLGDASYARDGMNVYFEGALVDTVATKAGETAKRTYQVRVTDGQLNLRLKDVGGSNAYVSIQAMEVALLSLLDE